MNRGVIMKKCSKHWRRMHQKNLIIKSHCIDRRINKNTRMIPEGCRPKSRPESVRCWENLQPHGQTLDEECTAPTICVMSYNILAQDLLECHRYLYSKHNQNSLHWKYRLQIIIKEIKLINPDIICLQEVQELHFNNISCLLELQGYCCIYKQRTGNAVDGCAICYKSSMLSLLDQHSVEFLQPNIETLNRNNIGLMAKFSSKQFPDIPFVVCTTHLLYNPKRSDIRLAQLEVLLAEIDHYSYEESETCPQYLPTILTGDFNSFPESHVTNLIANGRINIPSKCLFKIGITNSCQHFGAYLQRKNKSKPNQTRISMLHHSKSSLNKKAINNLTKEMNSHKLLFNNTYKEHQLKFKSVYDLSTEGTHRSATTFHDRWVMVDYIFYSSNNLSYDLQLIDRFHLPSIDECTKIGCIPSLLNGSDHYSLAAKFTLSLRKIL